MQVTGRGRERFDRGKRRTFLEWFAATCNARLAAAKAGVNYRTPYRARMSDAAFAEAWDLALEQGYARLEAELLEMQFRQASGEADEFDPAFEAGEGGGFEVGEDEAAGPLHRPAGGPPPRSGEDHGGLTDPTMAMQLLRQHKPEVMKIRASRNPNGSPGRMASDGEVRRALVKSLRAFGVRVTKEDLRAEDVRGTSEHGDEDV